MKKSLLLVLMIGALPTLGHADTITLNAISGQVSADAYDSRYCNITLVLDSESNERLTRFTTTYLHETIYLTLNDTLLTAPKIMEPISGDTIQMPMEATVTSCQKAVDQILSGAARLAIHDTWPDDTADE